MRSTAFGRTIELGQTIASEQGIAAALASHNTSREALSKMLTKVKSFSKDAVQCWVPIVCQILGMLKTFQLNVDKKDKTFPLSRQMANCRSHLVPMLKNHNRQDAVQVR